MQQQTDVLKPNKQSTPEQPWKAPQQLAPLSSIDDSDLIVNVSGCVALGGTRPPHSHPQPQSQCRTESSNETGWLEWLLPGRFACCPGPFFGDTDLW